ncbi:hypothetical protein A4D02_15790 [Niastella koreensis]|nr:hypothetical protein A4D02_15790 [Niastella koreensis]
MRNDSFRMRKDQFLLRGNIFLMRIDSFLMRKYRFIDEFSSVIIIADHLFAGTAKKAKLSLDSYLTS